MYGELFAGLSEDPAVHLQRTFGEPYDEIVLLRDIDFSSHPATGARIPGARPMETFTIASWSLR